MGVWDARGNSAGDLSLWRLEREDVDDELRWWPTFDGAMEHQQ
jgi:hypothetical protein